jgi:hypothetical protein
MFQALLAHPQKAPNKQHLVYCVRVMSVGCTRIRVEHSNPGGRCVGLTTLPTSGAYCLEIWSLNLLELSGPVHVSNGIALPFTFYGVRSGAVVVAQRYKPEGRGIDSRWCHWNFSLT